MVTRYDDREGAKVTRFLSFSPAHPHTIWLKFDGRQKAKRPPHLRRPLSILIFCIVGCPRLRCGRTRHPIAEFVYFDEGCHIGVHSSCLHESEGLYSQQSVPSFKCFHGLVIYCSIIDIPIGMPKNSRPDKFIEEGSHYPRSRE